jgi:hypothetical protein
MQWHPFPESNAMQAKLQNILSSHANKLIVSASQFADAVMRAARGHLQSMEAHATSIKNQATPPAAMLRQLAAHKSVMLAGLSRLTTALALIEVAREAPRRVEPAFTAARLTVEDHWTRATGIIIAALASFQRIKSLHAAAARQLDSADYALTQLLHDLRPAMALPADVSGLRAILAEAERTASEPLREQNALAA